MSTQETVYDYFDSDSDDDNKENYTPFAEDSEPEDDSERKKEFSSAVVIDDINATLSQDDFDTQEMEEPIEIKQPEVIEAEDLEEEPIQIIIETVAEPSVHIPILPPAPPLTPPPTPRIRGLPDMPAVSMLELGPKPGKRTITKNGHSIYENSILYQQNPCPSKEVFAKFDKLGAKRLDDAEFRVYYRAKDCQFNLNWVEEKMKSMGLMHGDELWWVRYNGFVSQGRYVDPWPDVGTMHQFLNGEEKKVVENSNQISRKRNTGYVILREL